MRGTKRKEGGDDPAEGVGSDAPERSGPKRREESIMGRRSRMNDLIRIMVDMKGLPFQMDGTGAMKAGSRGLEI
jgi:hypothetical protein